MQSAEWATASIRGSGTYRAVRCDPNRISRPSLPRTAIRGSPTATPPACSMLRGRGCPTLLEELTSLRTGEAISDRTAAFNHATMSVRRRRCRPQGMKPLAPAVPWAFSPRTSSVGKAGTHRSAAPAAENWTPAFAGEALNIIPRHEPPFPFRIRRPASSSISLTHAPCIASSCMVRPACRIRPVISCIVLTTSGWSGWPG